MSNTPKSRRFLRFRLRTLLLLPLVFAAGWWWATWPERTARRFVELLNAGEIESAKAMCIEPIATDGLWVMAATTEYIHSQPGLKAPTWGEFRSARRSFALSWKSDTHFGTTELFAERGRVVIPPAAAHSGAFRLNTRRQEK